MSSTYCSLRFALTGAIAWLAASAGAAASEPAHAAWFKIDAAAAQNWTVNGTAIDPNRVTITRRALSGRGPIRRVFVLYPRPSSAYDIAISRILQVFDEKNIDAVFAVVNFENDVAKARAALALAENAGNELIFAMGSESAAWLYANYRGGRLPVVSVCAKDPVLLGQMPNYNSGSGTNFAFTSLNVPIEVQMAYVRQLKPNLRNIGVLVDSKNVSAIETQVNPLVDYARRNGIRMMNVVVTEPSRAREELARLVADTVANMRKNDPTLDHSLFWITGSTAVFHEIATINAHSDRVPVLSVVPEVVQAGDDSAVLSVGVSFESNAHLAAVYGASVLMREARVGALKVGVVTPPDIAINFKKAREIGLVVPFSFFESASTIYDYEGRRVRRAGRSHSSAN